MIDPETILEHFYTGQPELLKMLLKHSMQVRAKALQILENSDLVMDKVAVSTGAMLHDTGIIMCHAPGILCRGNQPYITHGVLGAQMLRQYAENNQLDLEVFARICERHTGSGLTAGDIKSQNLPLPVRDYLPETPEEILICLADKFFSKSGNMEEKSFSSVRHSMEKFGASSLERFDRMCSFMQLSPSLPPIPQIFL